MNPELFTAPTRPATTQDVLSEVLQHCKKKELASLLGVDTRTISRWQKQREPISEILRIALTSIQAEANQKFKQHPTAASKFSFIDLFAGIGGIRLAFAELGGTGVFASEINPWAVKTYEANHGHRPAGDITLIPEEEIPNHDILLAGFPCQPFSQAGQKKGFDDMRGTLFFNIAEILRVKLPAAFMLENVKHLRGHDKGNTFRRIRETLEELGYEVHDRVLRAGDFGVPQNRERIFIVGFNKALLGHVESGFTFPEPPRIPTRVGDILEEGVPEDYTISDRMYRGHLLRREKHRAKGNGFGFCVFGKDSQYTSTISARYWKDGSEALIEQEGKNPRMLTPRECARLQGFPDTFAIPVSDAQAYRQFGNSVAIPVVRAVARKMIETLEVNRILGNDIPRLF